METSENPNYPSMLATLIMNTLYALPVVHKYLCSTTPTVNVPEATDLGTPRYKEQNDSQLCLHA